MARFEPVARVEDVPEGGGTVVKVGGEPVALFRRNGEIFAIHNTCLHKGGPLGEGELAGDIVTCPWHGWQYDIKTGVNQVNKDLRVRSFEVKVEDGQVMVGPEKTS